MNTFRRVFPAVILATALGVTAYVEAATSGTPNDTTNSVTNGAPSGPGGHAWRGGHGGHDSFHQVLRQLNLSADQMTQIKSIYAQAKPQWQSMSTAGRSTDELLATTAPTDPNYATALATAKANAVSRVQLASDLRSQIYAVLTPAQQAQIPGILAAEKSARDARKAAWQARHAAS